MPRKKGKQEYKASGRHESPASEYLEHVRCCNDTDCTPRMMKHAFFALKRRETGKNTKAFSELK